MARNYKKEYAQRSEYLKAYRRAHKDKDAARHRARRALKPAAGMEVDHKDGNAMNNNRNNLQIVSRKQNRRKGARKTNAKKSA